MTFYKFLVGKERAVGGDGGAHAEGGQQGSSSDSGWQLQGAHVLITLKAV